MKLLALILVYLFVAIDFINAFYVPGVAPQDFLLNDKVEVKVSEFSN